MGVKVFLFFISFFLNVAVSISLFNSDVKGFFF